MTTNAPSVTHSDSRDTKKGPNDLPTIIRELMDMEDEEGAARRLVEKLVSFSHGDVDIREIAQTKLRLLQADGTRPEFEIHPQGMEVDADTGLLYITAVEIIEARDKARQYWGKGRAHLFEVNIEGKTIRSVNLKSDNPDEYHPSGMVLTNGTMFIALAQYAPETSATIVKFNVKDWTYEKLFTIKDHVGLVVPNLDAGELFLGTWGSRHYYCTDMKGNIKNKRPTPCSDKMEHQDAQLINASMDTINTMGQGQADGVPWADRDGTMMLATGVTAGGMEYFGLDIVDVTTWKIKASLRWPSAPHMTSGGWPPFANPTFLWVDKHDRVLALAAPDSQGDDEDSEAAHDTTLALYTLSKKDE